MAGKVPLAHPKGGSKASGSNAPTKTQSIHASKGKVSVGSPIDHKS